MADNVTLSQEQFMQLLTAAKGSSTQSINTAQTLKQDDGAQSRMKGSIARATRMFAGEERVPMSIAVPYGQYCGGFVKVGINGVTVEMACDGVERKVPKSFAAAIKKRLSNYDEMYTDKGFSLNPKTASEAFRKGGLQSASVNSLNDGVKVAEVTHG